MYTDDKLPQVESGRSRLALFIDLVFFRLSHRGTYKVRNEIETKRNETKSTKTKRNEINKNETKRNEINEMKTT
jgi:hypothetical protein